LTKILKIALTLLLILTITLFIFILVKEDKKPIKIEPIKIVTSSTDQNDPSEEVEKEKSGDILSKLKVATKVSTEGIAPSKEEVSNKVLESLKQTIIKQKIEEPIHVQPIVKKVVKKRVVHKKTAHKKVIKKRVIAKKLKASTKKKNIKHAEVIKKQSAKEPIESIKVVENQTNITRSNSSLSREEEVALYQQKYASGLEVVKITKPFVIKEKKNVPDAYYFEAPKPVEPTNTNPTKFVKTLGVVAVSHAYETPLVIPEKVELAKEGIVEFPNAKLETEELKKLKFVKPLEVVEVSKPFETIEAEKYLK